MSASLRHNSDNYPWWVYSVALKQMMQRRMLYMIDNNKKGNIRFIRYIALKAAFIYIYT